jgi:hypothetical protein
MVFPIIQGIKIKPNIRYKVVDCDKGIWVKGDVLVFSSIDGSVHSSTSMEWLSYEEALIAVKKIKKLIPDKDWAFKNILRCRKEMTSLYHDYGITLEDCLGAL